MALDFPSNPTVGQEYTYDSKTWTYNGIGWARTGAGGGGSSLPTATQGEMEAGVQAGLRAMSPLLIAQAIAAQTLGGPGSGNVTTGAALPSGVVLLGAGANNVMSSTIAVSGGNNVTVGDLIVDSLTMGAIDWGTTVVPLVNGGNPPAATQEEMEGGIEGGLRTVSPLRVAQAVAAFGGAATGLPSYALVLWPTSIIASIPAGFLVADGTEGTENMAPIGTGTWIQRTPGLAPTIVDLTIEPAGNLLSIGFSRDVTGSGAGFTLAATGGAASLTYSSGEGTASYMFDISRIILDTETVTLDYNPGSYQSVEGAPLELVNDAAVDNQSSQTAAGGSAPTAPSALTATVATNTQINLAWTDNSSTEVGFKIYHGTASGSLTLLTTTSANTTSYNHTGLAPGSPHYYTVRATNAYGDSSPTAEANATTTGGAVPTAPSNLNAVAASDTQINLTWTDNSSDETGFKVYHGTTSGSLTLLTTRSPNATSYNHAGLSPGTTHYYTVRATNANGDSAATAEDSATTTSGGGGGGGLIYQDTFESYAAPSTLGAPNWNPYEGTLTVINSGGSKGIYSGAGYHFAYPTTTTTTDDQRVEMTVRGSPTAGNYALITLRLTPSGDFDHYQFRADGTNYWLYLFYAGGTPTLMDSGAFPFVAGDRIAVQMEGTLVTYQKDTGSGFVTTGSVVPGAILTGGIAGIGMNDGGTGNKLLIDDVKFYDLSGGGGGDVTVPTLTSATINEAGSVMTLVYSEAVLASAIDDPDFDLVSDGGALTMSYASGSGTTTHLYSFNRPVLIGETITLDYTQPTGGVEDLAGNDLATINDRAVTNNATGSDQTTDDFESYTAGTTLGAPNWNPVQGTMTVIDVSGQQSVYAGTGYCIAYPTTQVTTLEHRVEMTFRGTPSPGKWALALLREDTGGGDNGSYQVRADGTNYEIWLFYGETPTSISSGALALVAGNKFAAEITGIGAASRIQLQKDVGAGWVDHGGPIDPVSYLTNAGVGFGAVEGAGGTNLLLDDVGFFDV